MFRSFIPALAGVILITLAGGCATTESKPVAKTPPEQPKAAAPLLTPVAQDGRLRSTYAFPTGHIETSVLLLERDLPAEITSGEEFSYDLKVTNVNHSTIQGVTLRDDCASQLVLTRADPAPVGQKPPFVWMLGDMRPGESRTVRVVGRATGSEPFTSCASATYNSSVCLTALVVQPALKLTLTAPAEATPCDPIDVRVTVANTGTGTARDVKLAYPLPEGWTMADGKTSAQFAIDALGAGQSKEFVVKAKAARTGDFTSKASATSRAGLKAETAPAPTAVRQAVLAVKAEGPERVFAGRPVEFNFVISNTGTGTATAATVEAPIPVGVKFISATEGGILRDRSVVWNLNAMPVKTSRTVSMTLEPSVIGPLDGAATAKATCAAVARDVVSVAVQGIPALLLEVTDLTDPIEVGGQTVYEIAVTNQGSAPATNVKLNASLEASELFVSATGAKATPGESAVAFDTIPTIAPKAKVVIRVTVKCVKEGDTRFKVSLTSDQLQRPVEETESTNIYR